MDEVADTTYHNLELHANNKPPVAHSAEWLAWLGSDICPACGVEWQVEQSNDS